MSEPLALRDDLQSALDAHEARRKEPWSGVYHYRDANERIGQVIARVDAWLRGAGYWPANVAAISNAERLRLLSKAAANDQRWVA